jgi:hypothetical protein
MDERPQPSLFRSVRAQNFYRQAAKIAKRERVSGQSAEVPGALGRGGVCCTGQRVRVVQRLLSPGRGWPR